MIAMSHAQISAATEAADFRASLSQMPVYAENQDTGVLVDILKAIGKVSNKSIEYQVVPFARSISYVENGQVDFHLPLIEPPDLSQASFSLSSETIFHVNFVLYTNTNKPLDLRRLGDYLIETDVAHTPYFPFAIQPSAQLLGSLKKLEAGRIDGFIFADDATDPLIVANKLKNIERQLYSRFKVKFVLPKGEAGRATDQFLSGAIGKLRASGRLAEIIGPIEHPYRE
jgi:ABC-type amino acid transport substrate-binding protein